MGQGRQADAPAAEYVPIGQAAQLDIFRPEAKKPATHGAHAAWAATPLNVPAWQGTQVVIAAIAE